MVFASSTASQSTGTHIEKDLGPYSYLIPVRTDVVHPGGPNTKCCILLALLFRNLSTFTVKPPHAMKTKSFLLKGLPAVILFLSSFAVQAQVGRLSFCEGVSSSGSAEGIYST